jgi:hypothetical protein
VLKITKSGNADLCLNRRAESIAHGSAHVQPSKDIKFNHSTKRKEKIFPVLDFCFSSHPKYIIPLQLLLEGSK